MGWRSLAISVYKWRWNIDFQVAYLSLILYHDDKDSVMVKDSLFWFTYYTFTALQWKNLYIPGGFC